MNSNSIFKLTFKGNTFETENVHQFFQLSRVLVEESYKIPISLISLVLKFSSKHWHIKAFDKIET